MKSAPFQLHEPTSIDDALAALAEYGDEAKALAGGQSLIPMLATRLAQFEHLVDLNRITELSGLTKHRERVRIGAMTRHDDIEHSSELADCVPLLSRATRFVGHSAIRSRGTLGGSLAHADPAAEQSAVVLALDATLELRTSSRTRQLAASEFFESTWSTALGTEELLVAIDFPVRGARSGFAIEEFARRAGDFAVAGAVAAVALDADATEVTSCAVSVFGVANVPYRARATEAAVEAGGSVRDAASEALVGAEAVTDIHASAVYRMRITPVLVRRALQRAMIEAKATS